MWRVILGGGEGVHNNLFLQSLKPHPEIENFAQAGGAESGGAQA